MSVASRRRDPQIFGDQHLKHKLNRGRANPGCNIYVYRMPLDWDELEFARHFDHYGDLISCTIVRDKDSGESRGFGFIGYSDQEAVRKAILGMDGLPVGPALELPGKFLSVSPKRGEEHLLVPFPDCYPPAGVYGTEPPNTRAPPGANLYIYNIPAEWRDIELYRHFIHYGQLTSVKVMMKDENKESRGFGFVGYVNPISAQRAMAGMTNFCINVDGSGKRIQVTSKRGEESAARKCKAEIAFKDPAHPDYQKEPPEEIEAGAAMAESLGVRAH
ncbi:unnamed protein product [Prorocentrum cordatum]|uniref:RRM domain-containing protein n=1 Tax=Prorocentrum cordatum TaxID=2364126 RepID=A0ABN9SAR4_9DINO|nr:unnamed protein product [Polarella glacialis]